MKPSKQKKWQPEKKSPAPPVPVRAFIIWIAIALGIVALAVVTSKRKQAGTGEPAAPVSPAGQNTSTNAAAAVATTKPDFQKLKGKWLRPDGGYVVEIKAVDDGGKLDAGYFNPTPIHVAKAEATQEGNATKVFIELQDVNYPGSTYTLTYVAARDLLVGVYYQALQKQSFEVYFERVK